MARWVASPDFVQPSIHTLYLGEALDPYGVWILRSELTQGVVRRGGPSCSAPASRPVSSVVINRVDGSDLGADVTKQALVAWFYLTPMVSQCAGD